MADRVSRQSVEVLGSQVGKLRTTRQYGEILAKGDGGALRTTRQYIELLTNAIIYEESVSHTLNFAQDAFCASHISITDTLAFAQYISGPIWANVTNNLVFVDSGTPTKLGVASNLLALTDIVYNFVDYGAIQHLSHTLSFSQVLSDWFLKSCSHSLGLTDSVVWQGPRYRQIFNYIPFSQQVIEHLSVINLDLEDILQLTQATPFIFDESITDTLNLIDAGVRRLIGEHTLNFIQALLWGKLRGIEPDHINFSQAVNLAADYTRIQTNNLGIGHSFTYYLPVACGTKAYTPFIGETTTNIPNPPNDRLPLIEGDLTKRFLLEYPALTAPTTSIELRAPELDNIDRYAADRINRETRGGKLTIFADPKWPKVNTVIATFVGLTQTEIDDLKTFLLATLGQDVKLTDWHGQEWVGVIMNPDEQAVCVGKKGYDITLQLEGVMLESFPGTHALGIIDVLAQTLELGRSINHDLNLIDYTVYWVT